MLKYLFLATAFVPFTAEIFAVCPLAAQTMYPYPLVSNAERDMLYCYMETTDGSIVQLESLCAAQAGLTRRGTGSVTSSPPPSPTSTSTASNSSFSSSGGGKENVPTPGADGVTTCYPPGSPGCLNSQFDAPPPPKSTPSESSGSSNQRP
jgi:hypothetical protein